MPEMVGPGLRFGHEPVLGLTPIKSAAQYHSEHAGQNQRDGQHVAFLTLVI
jgi:hypothetical protein